MLMLSQNLGEARFLSEGRKWPIYSRVSILLVNGGLSSPRRRGPRFIICLDSRLRWNDNLLYVWNLFIGGVPIGGVPSVFVGSPPQDLYEQYDQVFPAHVTVV
jgi:hypothetical protein